MMFVLTSAYLSVRCVCVCVCSYADRIQYQSLQVCTLYTRFEQRFRFYSISNSNAPLTLSNNSRCTWVTLCVYCLVVFTSMALSMDGCHYPSTEWSLVCISCPHVCAQITYSHLSVGSSRMLCICNSVRVCGALRWVAFFWLQYLIYLFLLLF